MKAERNKTIDFLPEDAPEYLARCLRVTEDVPLDAVCGRTICGDTFQVAPHLPRGFADLLIVDPPYNLTKDFSGGGFRRTTDANYAAFTRAWIELLLPLLKPDASVYVCCDWRSSPVIGMTLKDYFRLQNRITWQREKGRGAQRNWKNGMEDIWFATRTDDYTFHVDAVKVRRRVRAPYRADGRPKDWEETPDGKFRNTCPSNFWDDISVPYWSMPENTAHPTQKPEKPLRRHRAQRAVLRLGRKAAGAGGDKPRHPGLRRRRVLGAQRRPPAALSKLHMPRRPADTGRRFCWSDI